MKTKHLLGALLSFLCTIIFFSCGNNNEEKIYPLSFEKEYYEQPLLRATDITSIRDQIRGRDTNMLLKQYIEKMKRLPKAQLEMFIHNTGELVENNEELTVYKELKDSGMIENLQKFSDDKRKDYIKVLNDTVQKRVEEKSHNNPNDKQTPNDEPEI